MSLVKVVFNLEPDNLSGFQRESVWAERISSDRYRIRNIPFFAKGASLEDIVFVTSEDGRLFFNGVSIYGGHSTYRILFQRKVSKEDFSTYWSPFKALGCTYEGSGGAYQILAVDVPPQADINSVYSLLEAGAEDGVWTFEEGHCGHTSK